MKKLVVIIMCLLVIPEFLFVQTKAAMNDIEDIFQQKHNGYCGAEWVDTNNPDVVAEIAAFDKNVAKTYDSMQKQDGRDTLWDGLDLRLESMNHYGYHDAFVKLLSLAKAYKKAGSKYYNNQQLKTDIISALEFLRERGYNDTTPLAEAAKGNWYYWEISIPQSVVSLMFYMRDDLPKDLYKNYIQAMKHFIQAPNIANAGSVAATGANLAWKCNLWIKIGVINNEEQMVLDGIVFMNPLFEYAEDLHSHDGFYKDGSFIQHETVAYNGGYGSSHVSEVLQVVEFLAGTKFAFPEEKTNILGAWIIDGFLPLLYNGNMMDMVRGREIARQNSTDRIRGISNLNMCFRVGQIVPDAYKKTILSEVRHQLEENSDVKSAFMKGLNDERKAQAEEMMTNPEYAQVDRPKMKIYNGMSRAVYTGDGFAFGIAMFSDKVKTHEYHTGERENKKGWFMSHGTTYLYTGDSTQFSRNFYPTVDPYMLPGITRAESERHNDEQGILNQYTFAGGTELDGKYGVVGFHMSDWPDKNGERLEAKKSYFCFDNQIVSLGLIDTKGVSAKTVIENRIVNSRESISYDGEIVLAENNQNTASKYVYLAGKNNTGYILGNGTKATLKTEERSGAWSDISDKSYNSKNINKNEFMTVYINHDKNTNRQPYEYVVLPSTSKILTEQYDSENEYKILENSDSATGIISLKNNMEMINFWGDDIHTVGSITAEGVCSVVVKEADGKLMISAADPTRKAERIKLKISKKVGNLLEKSEEIVKLQSNGDEIYLEINTTKNHIGVFRAVFESDTKFETMKPVNKKSELVKQNLTVLKNNCTDMLYKSERMPIYTENPDISMINERGNVYIPLRTLAMMYPINVKTIQNGLQVEYNGREVHCDGNGNIFFENELCENVKCFEANGVIYVPIRVFAEKLLELSVDYREPLIAVGSKTDLDKLDDEVYAVLLEELK